MFRLNPTGNDALISLGRFDYRHFIYRENVLYLQRNLAN